VSAPDELTPDALAAIGVRAAAAAAKLALPAGSLYVEHSLSAADVPALLRHIAARESAHAAELAAARASALREAAASEASEIAARDAAMRGTLRAPDLATMRALHRVDGCWLVSYDDDTTGDPVVTIEYLDGARDLAEKEGDNPVRWVAVDRCGRVCLPPQPDADALAAGGGA
jgi:predicted Zn-dependent protease